MSILPSEEGGYLAKFPFLPRYPFFMSILPPEEGGGYLIEFPDLPGCMSDGETIEETIENGKDAVFCWIETAKDFGDEIPQPGSADVFNGDWIRQLPEHIQIQLSQRAEQEGVNLNTLVTSMLSKGLRPNNVSSER
ncbi:type II toxin-antitoxin system HicB family antitoxin [Candidatus Poribacteria bacterium]|nr:type II toxin-antitoxin system HicB family antitoxin [Candidatus Poribacteria bacterium]